MCLEEMQMNQLFQKQYLFGFFYFGAFFVSTDQAVLFSTSKLRAGLK